MGPVLTMLALLAHRAELHSSGPYLTRHGTRVNHACPPRLPFTLDVELGRETVFHSDLNTLVLHTLVETSLVARISIVHKSPKPKQHMQGLIELHEGTALGNTTSSCVATFGALPQMGLLLFCRCRKLYPRAESLERSYHYSF